MIYIQFSDHFLNTFKSAVLSLPRLLK